jgi:hypothetical protein
MCWKQSNVAYLILSLLEKKKHASNYKEGVLSIIEISIIFLFRFIVGLFDPLKGNHCCLL